jgi:hypothetical protein
LEDDVWKTILLIPVTGDKSCKRTGTTGVAVTEDKSFHTMVTAVTGVTLREKHTRRRHRRHHRQPGASGNRRAQQGRLGEG